MAESINEGTLARFHKKVGDQVEADEEVASIETDKIDVAVNAISEGVITELLVAEGDVVVVDQDLAILDTDAPASPDVEGEMTEEKKPESQRTKEAGDLKSIRSEDTTQAPEETSEQPVAKGPQQPVAQPQGAAASNQSSQTSSVTNQEPAFNSVHPSTFSRNERVEKLSRMRKTIATRLKQSQNTCASLTTVQEIDMTALMAWRAKYKEQVAKQHEVKLGYMGAFAKSTTLAAKQIPLVNASIDVDEEIITYRDYVDISIAVSSPKGLVTPVVRSCEMLSVIELEREIGRLAAKARDGKLTMDDLAGGNFSISNPGIFNSMFGTPLINYPQAAVFNMNTIKDRVVAINGKAEIRPMMYITLTYDHRLIDGREAVSFLNIVKGYIEDPSKMILA